MRCPTRDAGDPDLGLLPGRFTARGGARRYVQGDPLRTRPAAALRRPPSGTHRLEFPRPRQFDVQEIRRLSPADYYRSLIGVCFDEEEGLRIWVSSTRDRGG